MAILKVKEIREMGKEEIDQKLDELKAAFMEERSKLRSTGMAEKPASMGNIRKAIARLETIRRAK